MNTLEVTLTDAQKAFIDKQVAAGGHPAAADYLLALLREAMRKRGWEIAEKLVLEGLDSPAREMTAADWERLRHQLSEAAQPKVG